MGMRAHHAVGRDGAGGDAEGRSAQRVIHRAGDRFRSRSDWLDSAHSFSFGAHYEADNVGFGRLMVSNHEIVTSGAGFDDHPHADAEIVTWVLSGSLVHADSAGHRGLVHRGLAQRMSAGRGIVHAERNDAFRLDPAAPEVPVEYVQMWVRPDEPGGQPSYQQAVFDEAELSRGWVAIASGRQDALVGIAGAATLWVTVLGPGERREVPVAEQVHLYLARGACRLEGAGELAAGDAVRLSGVGGRVTGLSGTEPAELLVWQMGP